MKLSYNKLSVHSVTCSSNRKRLSKNFSVVKRRFLLRVATWVIRIWNDQGEDTTNRKITETQKSNFFTKRIFYIKDTTFQRCERRYFRSGRKLTYVFPFLFGQKRNPRWDIHFFISKLIENTIFPIHLVPVRKIIESDKSHTSYKSGYLFYTRKKIKIILFVIIDGL